MEMLMFTCLWTHTPPKKKPKTLHHITPSRFDFNNKCCQSNCTCCVKVLLDAVNNILVLICLDYVCVLDLGMLELSLRMSTDKEKVTSFVLFSF